jgi:nucleoside phosphorylase
LWYIVPRMRQKRTNISELKGKVDFGIITIREDEFEAVLRRLPTEELVTGRQTYAVSRLKTVNEDDYVIASVRCPEQGNAQGQSVAHTLIEELAPQWLLLVGIAGSVPDYEYTLGDVLLAARLHDFSVSASLEDDQQQTSQQFSSGGGPMHPEVQSLVAALPALTPFLGPWNTPESLTVPRPEVKLTPANLYGDTKWKKKVRESLERYFGKKATRENPKAFTGSVASSDTLVKNTQLVDQWLRAARQVKGVEMELAGVYQAAWRYQKPVLAIRGISDIIGFKRSPDWTSYACNTAAAFAVALLRYRPITPLSAQESASDEAKSAGESAPQQSRPVGVFKNPPPTVEPVLKSETLYSNLLEVAYFPEKLHSAQTDCIRRNEVWDVLKGETEHPPDDWVFKGKTLYAFHDFSDPVWAKVCDPSTVESHDTSHWSDSTDPERLAEFVELLKGCLKELGRTRDLYYIHKQRVGGETKTFKYLYYAPTDDLSTRTIVMKSLVQSRPRNVFRAYHSKKTGNVSYYHHQAFKFEFVRFDGQWYLEITPTHHYTWNGYRVSRFYEDLLKGIKRLEKNETVFRHVLFWSRVLRGEGTQPADREEYPYLIFGKLLDFSFIYGVKDELWMNKEAIEKAEKLERPPASRRRGGRSRAGRQVRRKPENRLGRRSN